MVDLKKHNNGVHEGLKPYKCDICNKYWAQKKSLKRHINNDHGPKKEVKELKCDFCEKTFTQEGFLKRHLKRFHKGLTTQICENDFKIILKNGPMRIE